MKIVNPSFRILTETEPCLNGFPILLAIESAGRTCYKSESCLNDESSRAFVKGLIKRGHESVLEHQSVSVRIVCDRGVSHEIVRHRLASYSQESTRFCNYGKTAEGISFIRPCFWNPGSYLYDKWKETMLDAEYAYLNMINNGASPQEARSVLPNSIKTEIVVTMNLREWRHFFKLRAAGSAGKPHPQMLEITVPMLAEFKKKIPIVFDDIEPIKE